MFRSSGIGRARQQPSGLGGQGFVGREADPRADRAQREAAAHVADVLLGQPEAGRSHEGATGRDDRPQPAGHTRVVPEQTVQGQETRHRPETANTARQSEYNYSHIPAAPAYNCIHYEHCIIPGVPNASGALLNLCADEIILLRVVDTRDTVRRVHYVRRQSIVQYFT